MYVLEAHYCNRDHGLSIERLSCDSIEEISEYLQLAERIGGLSELRIVAVAASPDSAPRVLGESA